MLNHLKVGIQLVNPRNSSGEVELSDLPNGNISKSLIDALIRLSWRLQHRMLVVQDVLLGVPQQLGGAQ
jgi:hypothetical protein